MMIAARLALGGAAVLIVLAGLAWYAVEIFGSPGLPRRGDADADGALAPTILPHRPRRSATHARRDLRRVNRYCSSR
jgi:hypothetical protein